MFNALMEHKTSEIQLRILENRIRKLDQEEQRAREKIEKTHKRVQELERLKVEIVRK